MNRCNDTVDRPGTKQMLLEATAGELTEPFTPVASK